MNYYQTKALATRHIETMLREQSDEHWIIYHIQKTFGFSAKFVRETIELVKSHEAVKDAS